MLPDLRTPAGFDALRESGYGFNHSDRPQNFKMQAEILDVAIKVASSLTAEPEIISDTAYLVLDGLIRPPKGFEFFPRFPKEEVAQFCQLVVESRVNNLPLPMVCPVCPDYEDRGYKMSSGIGISMGRVFDNFEALKDFFSKRNFYFFINVQVADVEVLEPLILRAADETAESFLRKTSGSIAAIQARIHQLGLEQVIQCGSMMEAFSQSGLDYSVLKAVNAQEIMMHGGSKVRRTIEALAAERIRLGDFDLVEQNNHKSMAAEELADYATYGELVNGQAIILSPDTLSSMPAYNFLRGGDKFFNPTIYLGKAKRGGGEFLYE